MALQSNEGYNNNKSIGIIVLEGFWALGHFYLCSTSPLVTYLDIDVNLGYK